MSATAVNDHRIARAARPSEAVLVTGCSSGIGHATALALARAGLPVWASARKAGDLGNWSGQAAASLSWT